MIYDMLKMKKKNMTLILAMLLAFTMIVPLQSHAGFEWTPPSQVKHLPHTPFVPAPTAEQEEIEHTPTPMPPAIAPQAEVLFVEEQTVVPADAPEEFVDVTPRRIPNASMLKMPVPPMAMPPAASAPVLPVAAAPVLPAMPVEEAAPVPVQERVFADAMGFGSDIPLVMAMQQIVPPSFSYSFDKGVNPGRKVSWSGGKPWNVVLKEAVAPFGLTAVVIGNTVLIQKDDGEYAPVPDAVYAPDLPFAEPAMVNQSFTPMPAPVMASPSPVPVATTPSEPMPIPMAVAAFEPAPALPAAEIMPPQSYPRRQPPVVENNEAVSPRPTPLVPSPLADESEAIMWNRQMAAPATPVLPPSMMAELSAKPAIYADAATGQHIAVPPPVSAPSAQLVPEMDAAMAGGPVMDPFEIRFWHAEAGASLRQTLSDWASTSGVALLWNSPQDYMLAMPINMHGTFPDVVTYVLTGYARFDPRPLGRLHPNLPHGPSVLVVENYSSATN